ncbi:MAG: hypothetical protein JSU68_13135 [Phycisphaerales bacterium]|nr:MAG: hypothetical protein JSU68_13135 [Phycisphaerales bacterium]
MSWSGLRLPRLGTWLVALALCVGQGHASGQETVHPSTADPKDRPPTLFERNQKLVRDLKSLGPWEQQARLIRQANRNVFRQYGWDSAEDRFAEQLVGDVAQIPPWDFMGRFNFAFSRVSERYTLTEQQSAQIRPKILWHSMRVMGKHVTTLFDLSEEVLAARLEQRPFNPAEVARWSQLSEPIVLDARAEFETFIREVEPLLTPEQKEILEKDRAAEDRRVRTILNRLGEWQQGRWTPEDWGLQDDPFHTGGRTSPASTGDRAGVDAPSGPTVLYDPTDEDAWQRYVRDFIRRYRLDEEQSTTAWAILRDLRARAGAHRAAMEHEAAGAPLEVRMAPIYERLFQELRTRLDRIPTEDQRRAVEDQDTPSMPPGDGAESEQPGPRPIEIDGAG